MQCDLQATFPNARARHRSILGDVAGTRWAFLLSAVSFVGAALLALGLPSTWPLLVARIILICLGVALLVIGLRQRKLRKRRNNGQAARVGPI
jgi:uncharacterized membrane protein